MPRSLSQDSRGSYDSDKYSNYSESFDSDDGRSTRNTKTENSNRQKAIRKTYGSKAKKPPPSQTPRSDYVASRMKSARRNKANEYRNQIAQLQGQIEEFKLEHKILKKQGRLQERALQKFEDSESELPALLQRHTAEVKNLRDQIKKQRDKNQELSRKLKDNDLEIDKLKRQLKKYKRLVEEKHLDERESLQQKYNKAEQRAEDAEQRVQNVERYLQSSKNNHTHEIKSQKIKQSQLVKRINEMEEERERLILQIREKEKELDIKNIYSQRIVRAPHKLPSTASSFGSGHNVSNLSRKPNTTGSDPGPTPRERMLGYDKRLRDEQKIKKQELERERKAEEKRRQRTEWENQDRTRREEEERYHKQLEERRRLEDEEEERRSEERRRRAEEERKKRELEEAGYREKLEKERLEREERERKQREEEEKLKEIEKQKKAKEEEERQRREDEERAKEAAAVREKQHQLDLLKKKLADIDAQKEVEEPAEDPIFSPGRHRKDYTFTKVVENMHNGLPSHEPEVLPKRLSRERLFSDDENAYNPSAPATKKTVKKNLLTELFGDSKLDNEDKSNDIFSPKPPAKVLSGRRSSGSGKLNRPRQQAQTITSKPAIKAVDDIDDDVEELVL